MKKTYNLFFQIGILIIFVGGNGSKWEKMGEILDLSHFKLFEIHLSIKIRK